MKSKKLIVLAFLSLVSAYSHAAGSAFGADSVLSIMQSAMAPAVNKLTAQAITWLAVFASLQFLMTNYALLKSDGDIQTVLAKAAGSLAWIGICIYIINHGPQFIGAVGSQMFGLLGLTLPSPGSIIASTITVVATLAALAVGVGGVGIIGSTTAGMLLIYILLFILAVGMFFAFKIFMIQLELGLVVMLSPLSFAFLGMNALKDQGIAPFKALISLGYRILLMTLILSAFTEVSSVVSDALSGLSLSSIKDGIGDAMNTVLSALGAYVMLAYIFYKSDSIAASLAGGSTSMGTGDVASAAAAGAAVGAAIAAGGVAGGGALGQIPQSMSDFMKGLNSGGSVSNASPFGSGAADTSLQAPPRPPTMSMASAPGAGAAPAFDGTTKGMSKEDSAKIAGKGVGPSLGHVNPPIPKVPPDWKPGDPIPPASGSGSSSGIAGAGSKLEESLGKLVGHLENQGSKKPSFGERAKEANQHVAQEGAATHVSINTHHSD